MPYTVPEGFFAAMEEKIQMELEDKKEPAKRRKRTNWIRGTAISAFGVAAAVAVFFAVLTNRNNVLEQEEVEVMLALYQEDVFLNES